LGQKSDADNKTEVKSTFKNPVFNGADPWLVEKDGHYYYCFSSKNGISISKSKFLTRQGERKRVWYAPETGTEIKRPPGGYRSEKSIMRSGYIE